ncbi:MAG: AN1-type zinc finger protein [Candidatus Atabeyarchaeum deiterrae]
MRTELVSRQLFRKEFKKGCKTQYNCHLGIPTIRRLKELVKCLFCDKEVYLPFRCQFCEGDFCIDHRLPENHKCKNVWKAKTSPKKKEPSTRPVTSPVGDEDEPSPM